MIEPSATLPYGVDAPAAASGSAVSWPAIIAGTIVAASITLILLALGNAFGLASISPWAHSGMSAATFTVTLGIWLIIVQWIASALGGYITGRLRTRWIGTHTHEVFFRDTAHGLITWSLSAVVGAGLVALAGAAALGGGTHAAATVAGGAAQGAANSAASSNTPSTSGSYDIDLLFRPTAPAATTSTTDANAETARILATGVNGDVSAEDRAYLAQLVAVRAGVTPDVAKQRVDTVIAREKAATDKAKQLADQARKVAATASLFLGMSMLIGAFIAAVAAAFGGSLRDEHP